MPTFTFWDYTDSDGQSVIAAWLDTFPDKLRLKIKSKLVTMIQVAWAQQALKEPLFERLTGEAYRDLIAMRFERNKVVYRVFACYGEEARGQVWLLSGGTEKNNRYKPPGVLDTALGHRASIMRNRTLVKPTCLLIPDENK